MPLGVVNRLTHPIRIHMVGDARPLGRQSSQEAFAWELRAGRAAV